MKRRRTLKPVGHEITEKIALIYEKHAHRLYCTAMKYTSNQQDAEEAVQQVFESIILNPDKILTIPENEVIFFLYAILRNTIYSMGREKKKNFHMSLDFDNCSEYYDLKDPEDAYMRYINLVSLKEKISHLKPTLRDTVLFYYVYGFNHREIAEMFHISERAVRKRIFQSKKEMRKMFRKEDFYEQ